MTRKSKLIIWLVVGIILCLGPIWGAVGTVVGMMLTFAQLAATQSDAETVANGVSVALLTTVIGWVLCPIGIGTVIVSAIKLSKCDEEVDV